MTLLDGVVSEGSEQKPADPRDPIVRLEALLDEGSPKLITPEGTSGVLAAMGRVEGVPVVAFCSDARVQGGAMGGEGCEHIVHAYDVAVRERVPIIGIWHSGGARLAEGVESLHAVGRVFAAMTKASGVVPQISVVVGPAAGGAAYGPALTDLVVLADSGRIFVTGPDVVRSVTGESVDSAALGGPEPHGRHTMSSRWSAACSTSPVSSCTPSGRRTSSRRSAAWAAARSA
jgi:acetyl-CoA/propionyl-CoA carboxylase carboxyl transferase subunit